MSFQHITNIKQLLMRYFTFFFGTGLQNLLYILCLQPISIRTSHITSAQKPCVAGTCHTGQGSPRRKGPGDPFSTQSSITSKSQCTRHDYLVPASEHGQERDGTEA